MRTLRSRGTCLAGLIATLALGGCGLGAGPAPTAVQLTVTRDFGAAKLHQSGALKVTGQETVMSLLKRNHAVGTRFGGGFVQSIDGRGGGREAGRPVDWFYFINGIQAMRGAAEVTVHAGDHIWWDLHDWGETEDVPAVVGSYPEPFLNGIEGKRLPVRVECAAVGAYACATVTARLRAAGVPAAIAAISGGGAPKTLRVLVGPWQRVAVDPGAAAIERGPRVSGVYAQLPPGGATLSVLDRRGRVVRTLGAGAGLIAATRQGEDAPVWFVTGTDQSGLDQAARGFGAAALADRFAVAFAGSDAIALPAGGGG